MTELEPIEEEILVWPNGELVDVASITAHADDARHTAGSAVDDTVIRTPDWVAGELAVVSRVAARMVLVILKAEEFKRQAARQLNRAKAAVRWEHRTLPDRALSAKVTLDVFDLQAEYDAAVIAFEYARRMGNLLSDYTSRVQSIGKQVELTYRNGGA